MWEEWRRASETFPSFVHNNWGATNNIDISRNLSKFGKIGRQTSPTQDVKRVKKDVAKSQQNDVAGVLIDEKEVLSVLFRQVEDMGSDSEDDDEKDNIYSQLEVRQDKKTDNEGTKVVSSEGQEACGYCTKACFCSPGHRIKRPYNPGNGKGHAIDPAFPPRNDHLQLSAFRDEALNTIAKLCAEKLQSHTDSYSSKVIKEKYAARAEKLVSSVCEFYELADQIKTGSNRKDGPAWSEEQAREMLCAESMQDWFQASYSSPYEGEDRRASNESRNSGSGQRKKRKQQTSSFMSKKFLQNY